MVKIYAICEKNGKRSPLFEGLMQDLTQGRTDVEFSSAGLYVEDGPRELANGVTHEQLDQLGVRITRSDVRQFNPTRANEADLIITFNPDLADSIRDRFKSAADRVVLNRDLRKYEDKELVAGVALSHAETWSHNYALLNTPQNQYALREAALLCDARDLFMSAASGLLAVINRQVQPTEPALIALQAKMASPQAGRRDRIEPKPAQSQPFPDNLRKESEHKRR